MTFDLELARFNMVEQQIRPWDVLDKRVLETFFRIPRERFVPADQEQRAFSDTRIPLGHGESMLAPVVEGRILQSLLIQPHERVLEIGTGSGFFTACLAHLGQSVRSVDIHADFTATAARNLDALGDLVKRDQILLETGDAHASWAEKESFDVIVLTGATVTVPEHYKRQLTVGGRLFVIVGKQPAMSACVITRTGEDTFETTSSFDTETRYLVGAEPKPEFDF